MVFIILNFNCNSGLGFPDVICISVRFHLKADVKAWAKEPALTGAEPRCTPLLSLLEMLFLPLPNVLSLFEEYTISLGSNTSLKISYKKKKTKSIFHCLWSWKISNQFKFSHENGWRPVRISCSNIHPVLVDSGTLEHWRASFSSFFAL